MRWGSVLVILAVVGCSKGGVRAVVGDVDLSSSAVHFESAFVGYSTTRELILRNSSRTDRPVSLIITGPFSTEPEAIVPGGSQRVLTVRFAPLEPGPALGTLTLSDGQNTFEVALDGAGVSPAICTPSAPCVTSTFDASTGACVETLVADGSQCTSDNACFLGGTCAKGVCLGTARDCADTDLCTLDTCDPTGGCMHLPKQCAAPLDPCKVARCDSKLGCVTTDALDGTACGPGDCSSARVCILGECKSRPVPDGATCGAATPCQSTGICQQQVCERPPPTPLVEAWSYDFPGQVSGFRGVTDPAENLYWVECAFGGILPELCDACTRCAATSYTRNGSLRFRQVLPGSSGYQPDPLHLIAGNQLVYAMPFRLGAVSISDGTPLWSRATSLPIPGAPDVADFFEVTSMLADATGVYLLAARHQGSGDKVRQSALMKLDPATGAVIFTKFFDGNLSGAVLDEQNNLYIVVVPHPQYVNPTPGPPSSLISFNSAGTERWVVLLQSDHERPLAVFGGELIMAFGEVRSTVDGLKRVAAPGGSLVRNPLMTPLGRTLLIDPPSQCCPTCPCPQIAPRVDAIRLQPDSPVLDWQTPIATSSGSGLSTIVSEPVATRQGDLLIARVQNGKPVELSALNAAGAKRFSCEIPTTPVAGGATSHFITAAALLSNRWAVVEHIECLICAVPSNPRLRVFEVPGERPTLHGWVGTRGSPSGSSRPLP